MQIIERLRKEKCVLFIRRRFVAEDESLAGYLQVSWWDVTVITDRHNICCKSTSLASNMGSRCITIVWRGCKEEQFWCFSTIRLWIVDQFKRKRSTWSRPFSSSIILLALSLSLPLSLSLSLSLAHSFLPHLFGREREWTSLVLSELTFKVSDWNCYGGYTKNHSTSAIDRCWERIDIFLFVS